MGMGMGMAVAVDVGVDVGVVEGEEGDGLHSTAQDTWMKKQSIRAMKTVSTKNKIKRHSMIYGSSTMMCLPWRPPATATGLSTMMLLQGLGGVLSITQMT
jgi:hypothetical protein